MAVRSSSVWILGIFFFVATALGWQFVERSALPAPDFSSAEARVAEALGRARSDAYWANDAATWGTYGKLLHAHGYLAAADDAYFGAANRDPTAMQWPHLRAHIAKRADVEKALTLAEAAVLLEPRSASAQYLRGTLLEELGRFEEAVEAYDIAAIDVPVPAVEFALGRVQLRLGEPELARMHLLKARELAPDAAVVVAYIKRLDPDQADVLPGSRPRAKASADQVPYVDPFLRGVSELGVSSYRLAQRAQLAMDEGRYTDAAELYGERVEAFPERAQFRVAYALALLAGGDYTGAAREAHAAHTLDADHEEALMMLATVKLFTRRFEEAAALFDQALERLPHRRVDALQGLGRVHASQGKYARALDFFEQALKFDPNVGEIYFDMAKVRADQDDFEGAWKDVATAESLGMDVGADFKSALSRAHNMSQGREAR